MFGRKFFGSSRNFLQLLLVNDCHVKAQPIPLRSVKEKSQNEKSSFEFIDYKHVRVTGGKGGDGMICFSRLWCNPMAGPSGGDGGNGGHVVFEARHDVKSLNMIKSTYTGEPGEKGHSKDMAGKCAEHLVIPVPVGTMVKEPRTQRIVADLYAHGMKFMAARGGAGGKGNHFFLNNKNRHPRVAEIGADGERQTWALEMKIIAHAGLVGFPNAGKSTLLAALTRARPKIASYPFTTLKPSVGMARYDDGQQLAIADLPGLIPDAHRNRGLGLSFLRHVERCVCLCYVVDITADHPYGQLQSLAHELRMYNQDLSIEKRATLVIVNKMDSDNTEKKFQQFQKELYNDNHDDHGKLTVIPVSAKYGTNLNQVLIHLRELYDQQQQMTSSNLFDDDDNDFDDK